MAFVRDKLNAINMIRDGLRAQIQPLVYDSLMDEAVAAYRKELELIIKPVVERVSLECVETYSDALNLRDELRVVIRVED